MPNNNKLFLRELSSPYGDISRKRTLSFKDLDSNFIFLKGELIDSITVENGNFILKKLSGEDINIPISEITQSDDELLKSISGATEELRLGITENRLWDNGTEGINSIRIKNDSGTDATGDYSHAEGANTTASGSASHAEGSNTRARGTASHAGGASSQANGDFSFAHTKGTSKADGESSVVLGGALHVVENGGENSGVLLGNTNRILGLDYQKLISDTENEINRLKDKRDEENANYEQLQNDLSEEIEKKQSEIDILNDEIKDIEEEITTIQNRINVINRYPVDDTNVNILTKKIQDLSAKKQEKLQAISSLTYEIGALQFEIESSTDIESEAQQNYDEERERLEKLLDEYNKSLYEFDGYLPKQSTIVGGDSNIINSASESIINGGSGNTISSKIKNSGIFGGSKNELGGGTYIVLITRLLEELSQRAEEKAKYDDETEKLISHLQSDIADKQKQLQSEKQQQPQDLGLIATLEADIKELKEEKKVLEEGLSRNNEGYVEYVNETNAKIESYRQSGGLYVGDEEEGPSTVITPIDGASIIAGSGNKIIHLSDNSSIVGGKSNLIDNASGSVILGGEGITATNNNTVYTPNLNIDIQPANDNSLTQVLVRDGDGNVKYKDVASFTDLSVVSGVYDIRTGIVTFINNDGDSFEISGFTSGMTDSYTTDAYLEDKTIYFNNNIKGDDIYSVDISPILDDVIASIGLNDNRGICSIKSYNEYQALVENYYTSKEAYDEYDSNIKTLTDGITQLNSDIDILKSDLEFKFTDVIYTQITGGSVEELQIIIDQKEADLNSKQAELEQKQVQRQSYIVSKQQIIDSGDLEFAPYVPANEANFNCWSERQIIDSVGYDNRGNCSGDRYEKYLSEYNSALEFFNTQIPSSPPAFKEEVNLSDTITYNNLSTERQKIIDYWVEHTTYTNNLISSYVLEIAKYQTILDTLNAIAEPTQSQQDEIEGLVKIIPLLENRKSELESEYAVEEKLYINLIDWFDHNLSHLESTDEYNFIQEYTPINEVNFNCWNDSEDYNDLNAQITGITSAVGYDDRGSCSEEQYVSYKSEVQKYYDSKEVYDQYDSSIKTLTDEINQLNDDLLNASTQQEIDTILANIEQKQVQRQSYIVSKQQIIDSGDLEFAPYVPANEVNFNCWRNELLDDKIDTKTDLSLFKSYTSSTETIITGITSAVGYDDRGTCSEEQYTEYNAYVDLYYTSKEEYDTYESNIEILTDEITQLNSDIDTLETEINTLDRTIILARLDGIDRTDNQNLKNQKSSELSQKKGDLEQKQVQRQSYIDSKQQIIDSGVLEFAPYVPANETNFNCWVNQGIIDSVGYDDRGTCDSMSYNLYQDLVHQLKAEQSEYNKIIREFNYTKEVRTVQNQIFKKEYDVITDNIAFYQGVINQINQTIEDEGRDATSEELTKIAALEQLIEKFTEEREQLVDKENNVVEAYNRLIANYNEWIINFENNTKPDIDRYLPENEVNYSCWRNEFFYENAQNQRDAIISAVGYNDRGSCSEEQYAEYTSKVQEYYDSKEIYDQYESNIQTLTDEITVLESSKTTKESELSTKESELSTKQDELESIKPGSDFIIANSDYIITNSNSLINHVNNLKTDMEFWNYGETETGFFEKKTALENDIASSIDKWNILNDLMVVNTTFNYQNKEDIIDSLTIIKNSLDDIQTILDTMVYTDTEEVFSQNKTDIINSTNSSISSSQKLILDVTLSRDYYVQTNNDLQNDIEQLQNEIESNKADIVSLSVDIEQKQVQKKSYIDSKQQIIDSGVLDFVSYVPANEANFNCYINSLQNDKIDNIITNNDYQIYDIESILINSNLPGTFNYYPNLYDDFSENPKFIIGEFDDLDNIINLDGGDLRSWGKLICIGSSPGSPGVLWRNLTQSIRCIETLISDITNTEIELSNDFSSLKNNYEQQLAILQGLQIDDPAISTDALELKISNMVEKRNEESDLFSYMVQKLNHVLNIYEQVDQISQNFCNEGDPNEGEA